MMKELNMTLHLEYRKSMTILLVLFVVMSAAFAPIAAAQTPGALGADCQPAWVPTFGAGQGFDGHVFASVVFDDGSGPALYVSGHFKGAGGVRARNIAKWDGKLWSALGSGMNQVVNAMAVFDDGTGPALYAGGIFTTAGDIEAKGIAKWDGSSWSAVGNEQHVPIFALTVFDDGTGPALYAGGGGLSVSIANGHPMPNYISKWNGQSWSTVGSGVNWTVLALTVFDDGDGPALIAGGQFFTAEGVVVNHIAAWDGSAWRPLGIGTNNRVRALTVFDDGTGSSLYAGTEHQSAFLTEGLGAAGIIVRWDGQSWSPVGEGISHFGAVFALTVFDDGLGPALYAGGDFSAANGAPANTIARWDGQSWSSVSSGVLGLVNALTLFDDGKGEALYAGGSFDIDGGFFSSIHGMARWDGQLWSSLENGPAYNPVKASTVFDDGTGPALYVGGEFTRAGGIPAFHIAKWDGEFWSSLGTEMVLFEPVQALAVFDDGTGPALFAGAGSGGGFITQDADATRFVASTDYIAKWDGKSWSPLGIGLNSDVDALAVFDDGSGAALYAGGKFDTAGQGTNEIFFIAKWDGQDWSPLDNGLDGFVEAMAVFDDGTGPALYVGGAFHAAGGVTASGIAKWDGLRWSPVGNGFNGIAKAFAVFDDGTGPALYAGGDIATTGGVPSNGVAKWDGSQWSTLGNGINGFVNAMSVYDDGSGSALYIGGDFSVAGGSPGNSIARWDGQSWSELGPGLLHTIVRTMTVFDDGEGPALFVGGNIYTSPAGDKHLTKWKGCDEANPADFSGDGAVNGTDLALQLADWGPCAPGNACRADLNADGVVDSSDLTLLLANWG